MSDNNLTPQTKAILKTLCCMSQQLADLEVEIEPTDQTFLTPVNWTDGTDCYEGVALYTRSADGTTFGLTEVRDLLGDLVAPTPAELFQGACVPEPVIEPTRFLNAVNWTDGTDCVEGKAMYRVEADGSFALENVFDLQGTEITPIPTELREGACVPVVEPLPTNFLNAVHWTDGDDCFEGKGLYTLSADGASFGLSAVFDLQGVEVTPTPANLQEGRCPTVCEETRFEWVQQCDLDPDVSPNDEGLICAVKFMRRFTYDCEGVVLGYDDFELDRETPYTPVQVVECGENPPSLRYQRWEQTSIQSISATEFIYTITNTEDPSQSGTVLVTTPNSGIGGVCAGTAESPMWNGPTAFTIVPSPEVVAAASIFEFVVDDWDTFEDITFPGTSPLPDHVESTGPFTMVHARRYHSDISNQQFTARYNRMEPQYNYTILNTGGGNSCSGLSFAFYTLVSGPPCGEIRPSNIQVQPMCDVDQTFLRHYVQGAEGIESFYDTDINGAPYVPANPGQIQIGSCCDVTRVTTATLCDLNPLGPVGDNNEICVTKFIRATTYNCVGEILQTEDFEMDGVTPYAPVEVVDCDFCPRTTRQREWEFVSRIQDPAFGDNRHWIFTFRNPFNPAITGTVNVVVAGSTGCSPATAIYGQNNLFSITPDATILAADILRVHLDDLDTGERVNLINPLPTYIDGNAMWTGSELRGIVNDRTGYMVYEGVPPLVQYNFRVGSCLALNFSIWSSVVYSCCQEQDCCPDIKIEMMCDSGTPFMRQYKHQSSRLLGYLDTTLDGETLYTVTNEATITPWPCP